MSARLLVDHVRHRLDGYSTKPDAEAIVDQGFKMGQIVLQETLARTKEIEAKAVTVLGYATAALAFLLVGPAVPFTGSARLVLLVPGACCMLAIMTAYLAVRVERWPWFHDVTWFPDPARLVDARHMRYHHLLDLFEVQRGITERNERKVRYLKLALRFLIGAAVLLFVLLALSLV
jgi:hypothetical protein